MGCFKIAFYGRTEFVPAQFGHHYVGYDKNRVEFPYYGKRLFSIRTGLGIIIRFEHVNKIIAQSSLSSTIRTRCKDLS